MDVNNLKLCGKITNLKEIINATVPFTEEVYEILDKAIPVQVLFELMLTEANEPVIMDSVCDNLLKPVIFIDLYNEIDINKIIRDNSEQFVNVMQDNGTAGLENIQNVILESNIDNFETFCLKNFDKIVRLFTAKDGVYFLSKVFNKNLYIPRRIIHPKKLSPLFFNNLSDDAAWYYFYGDETKFNILKSFVKTDVFDCLKFAKSKLEAKRMFENTPDSTPVHLLKIVDNEIFLRKSQGNISSLRKYIGMKRKGMSEMDLEVKSGVRIITGEPGVGKSSLLASLSLKLQLTHWIFVVQLNQAQFTKIPVDGIDFDEAADFITSNSNVPNPDVTKYLLSYCLKNETNLHICLMLDGYDEINEKPNRRKLIRLINFLRINMNTKIFVTSRKYRCQELENGLCMFALQLESLNQETDIVKFFCEFWYCRLHLVEANVENAGQFQELTFSMLESAKRFLGEDVYQLLGVPLHMRMMAEIITPHSSTTEINFADPLTLYKKYVETHYAIYFKKHALKDNQTLTKWLSDSITHKHYNLAIFKMFSLDNSIDYNDVDELNKVGLIQCDTNDYSNLKFLYESIRDYFVAHILQHWLQSHFEIHGLEWNLETFIITDCLVKPEFKDVRLFLNLMLSDINIANKKLEYCQNNFHKLWDSDTSLFFNESEESAFHVCVRENLYHLLKHFLLNIIVNCSDQTNLLAKRNANFETALFLAHQQNDENSLHLLLEYVETLSDTDLKTVLLSTFFTTFITVKHLDTVIKYAKDFIKTIKILNEIKSNIPKIKTFLNFCENNDYTNLVQLLEELRHDKTVRTFLVLVCNVLKETGLHLTSNKDIVNILLKNGANINAQDHHGMTPLNRALKRGNTEIAKRLIEKGALNIPDLMGNSSLIHAAKYDHLEIIRMLLNKGDNDIEQANIYNITPLIIAAKSGNENVINYLLDKGANINAVGCNGMTALFCVVKANHNNLIRILRQKGADINVQDNFGTTPLLFSISKRLWSTVNYLLGNGADVNIGNSRRVFPLQLLIEMEQNNMIKKIMHKEIINIKGGGTIIREAAVTDMLSDEQKAYIIRLLASRD